VKRRFLTMLSAARGAWVAAAPAVTLTVVALIAGCGYQQGGLFDADVRTVAVPIFENQSFYRGLEFDLTEATIKQIELKTPYKVVGPEVADTVLQGTITGVEQTLLSRGDAGLPQELELRVTLDIEWLDARTGRPLRSREGFEVVGHYVPARRVGQPLEAASHAVAQRLADRVVSMMFEGW
jgi:hypothetical protein